MKTRTHIANERGQATTELALMMCIILAFFFWALQAEIILGGMHQGAYAAFNSARILVTSHHGGKDPDQDGRAKILTGKIFTEAEGGPASLSTDLRDNSKWSGAQADGVNLTVPQFASLPYAHVVLNFDLEIPTHLGPDEWDDGVWTDSERDQEQTQACTVTDNNQQDGGSC